MLNSTIKKNLYLKSDFLPGPSSNDLFDIVNKRNEMNSSSYIYSFPTNEFDEKSHLFFFIEFNQTIFHSSSLSSLVEDSLLNSSKQFYSIVLGIILFTITIWTIFGNILVILAFLLDKQICQGGMSNYLIINLAISDLLLGIAVLPFSASYSTFGFWYFGKFLCEFWLAIDVLCSTASIWVTFLSLSLSLSQLNLSPLNK